jgi:hypothetical protein
MPPPCFQSFQSQTTDPINHDGHDDHDIPIHLVTVVSPWLITA